MHSVGPDLNTNCVQRLSADESLDRGVEIVKFSTCPGTSKWP